MTNGPWGGNQGGNGPWGNGGGGPGKGPSPKGPGNGGKQPFRPDGKDPLDDVLARLKNLFGDRMNLEERPSRAVTLGAVAIGILWLASGFYVVDSKEVGVVQRFGRFVGLTTPGLRYHFPSPIESVTKLGVLSVNTVEIGFRSGMINTNARGDNQLKREKLMLTGDQNIVEIGFDVQWKIDSDHPEQFLFNVRDAEGSIRPVAESAMREVIARRPIGSVLAKQEEKLKIEVETRDLIQTTLDAYGAGIHIEKVNLLKSDPPSDVIDAFRAVKTAEQDKETIQNRARTYANGVVPEARGEAERILREAEGYKQAVVAEAEGNAARFRSVVEQYHNAPDATAKRLYIETMEDVLRDVPKVVLDSKSTSGAVPYFPLPVPATPAAAHAAEDPDTIPANNHHAGARP